MCTSASSMKPRPIKMRATPRARSASVDMNSSTPSATSTVHSHFTSSENTCATTAEPTSAPRMTAPARSERGQQQGGGGRTLQHAGHADAGAERSDAGARVDRDRAPQRRAERARHASAHHAHAPEQERDTAEEGGEQLSPGHPCPSMPPRLESTGSLT